MATVASVPRRRGEEPEWVVWLTVGVALILGFVLMQAIRQESQSGGAQNSTVVYPASWVEVDEAGADFAAADINGGGPFGARVSLRVLDKTALQPSVIGPSGGDLQEAATAWSFQRGKDLVGYRVLDIVPVTVQGRDAINVESVYLMEAALGGSTNTIPGLMHTVDTVVAGGDKYYILTFAADTSQFDHLSEVHQRLLDDWRIP